MTKKTIKGFTKNTGKYVLKGATKALGLGLVSSGVVVSALSKSHIVRGIGPIAATIMCPGVAVCVAEMMIAKNLIEGIVTDKDPMAGIGNDLQRSTQITGKLVHEIGKGLQETGKVVDRASDKIKLDR